MFAFVLTVSDNVQWQKLFSYLEGLRRLASIGWLIFGCAAIGGFLKGLNCSRPWKK
jgi:hypothetical protein